MSANDRRFSIEPIALPPEAFFPGLRDYVLSSHRKAAELQIATAREAVKEAKKKLAEIKATVKITSVATVPVKDEPKDHSKKTSEIPTSSKSNEQPATAKVGDDALLLRDDFSAAKPDVWEPLTGKWTYENGRLIQSQTGAGRASIRLKGRPPSDFEAKLKYIPTDGQMWKSVGIACDITSNGNELMAYASSAANGPRSQISYKESGKDVYPPTASQRRTVELNQPHEIVFRARGTLLNMSVDGEHSIAFRLPANVMRQPGALELVAFDAKVEFISFELKALPTDFTLVEANSLQAAVAAEPKATTATAAPATTEQAQLGVTIAEKALQTTELNLVSIEARAAALAAQVYGIKNSSGPSAKDLALAATKSERTLTAAKADEEVTRAELALLQAADDKKDAAEKKLAAAKTASEAARKAIDTPSETFTPLPGAKKTQEDYQNRNASKPYPPRSTGRRTALANWLTDPRHPLPARVAINHIWARHMGKPLVHTVFDFGRKGTPPTHPELLDWLAVELVDHQWSMKHIHRLIVTSQAYRRTSSSSAADAATLATDPENKYYWRMNPVRMESQIVRDSLLSLAGDLDVSLGGPSVAISDQASRRRSLYFVHSHNDHDKFLSTFDDANVLDCYRRAESIVPQQALALENSSLATAMAAKITQRILAARPNMSDSDFIRQAFTMILSVEPTGDERATMSELLIRMTELAKTNKRPMPENFAKTNLVHTLLNHNDFISIR